MKRSRFTETQVVKIIKQHEAGISVKELCKEHGISAATFYNWKGKYGGMDASPATARLHLVVISKEQLILRPVSLETGFCPSITAIHQFSPVADI